MAVANTARGKASGAAVPISTPETQSVTDEARAASDLLAGLRWGTRELLVAATVLVVIVLFAGWSYLASYFGYFRVPADGLQLGLPEVLAQGLRSILLPLTVIVLAASAPSRKVRPAAVGVAGYLLFLALAALINHWASPSAVVAQLAASIAIGGAVFAARLGFGRTQGQRLIIGAVGLLLLVSLPVATGTLDASDKAGAKQSTLRIVTSAPILPNAVPSNGLFTYSNYVLLRENDTRYWLFRIGDQYVYSIAKSQILYVRY